MSKKCPVCNEILPDEASFCMNCFNKIVPLKTIEKPKNKRKKIFFIISAFIAFLLVFSIILILYPKQPDNKTVAINTITQAPTTEDDITELLTTKATTKAVKATNKNETSATTEAPETTKTTETTQITTSTTEAATEQSSTTTEAAPKETSTTKAATVQSTTSTTKQISTATTKPNTTKKETTQPSGTLKYSGYGNGIIITSYSGNEKNIIIPDKIDGKSVLAVMGNAFSNNKHIKSITFEEGTNAKCLNIKSSAFCNLEALTTINLPSQIEADDFASCIKGCPKIENINISSKFGNNEYYSSNGIIYKESGNNVSLVLYPAGKSNRYFAIPYKVTAIGKNAFMGNAYLAKLKFSKREKLNVNWSDLFSKSNLKNLEKIEVYVGTDADIKGIQHFDGEISYYD